VAERSGGRGYEWCILGQHRIQQRYLLAAVKRMSYMFMFSDFISDISKRNVSTVEDMIGMFYGTTALNSDISTWNVAAVKSTAQMFEDSLFNGDISQWNASAFETTVNMFYNATAYSQNLCTLVEQDQQSGLRQKQINVLG
jgi:surface protein